MSRSRAINQKCKECIYDPSDDGTWRQQVEACEIRECSLYPYRPKSIASARICRKNVKSSVCLSGAGLSATPLTKVA